MEKEEITKKDLAVLSAVILALLAICLGLGIPILANGTDYMGELVVGCLITFIGAAGFIFGAYLIGMDWLDLIIRESTLKAFFIDEHPKNRRF